LREQRFKAVRVFLGASDARQTLLKERGEAGKGQGLQEAVHDRCGDRGRIGPERRMRQLLETLHLVPSFLNGPVIGQ
jgi:hypothetical protein